MQPLKLSVWIIFFMNAFSILSAPGQTGPAPLLPSPSVATLQRYVDYPIDYSTGMVNVSIPLYTIKINDFEYPISVDSTLPAGDGQQICPPWGWDGRLVPAALSPGR